MALSSRNPWVFVPLLYFTQAIPVTLVQEVASIAYKDLGIDNAQITQWTAVIALPWGLQMLLGPLVDLNSTKRRWIVLGQLITGILLALSAFTLLTPSPFALSLLVLGFAAIASALTNVATDGFFILALSKDEQAGFAGIQTTFYRMGRLFGVGLIVTIAGLFVTSLHLTSAQAWSAALLFATVVYGISCVIDAKFLPHPDLDADRGGAKSETRLNLARTFAVIAVGLGGYFLLNALTRIGAQILWQTLDGKPEGTLKGWMLAPEGTLVFITLPGLTAEIVQAVISLVAVVVGATLARRLLKNSEMETAFTSFLRQPGIGGIFAFLIFYRFAEAMVNKLSPLFLKDTVVNGGLAIGNDQLGLIKGVAGMAGMILGGITGGALLAKFGLRRAILPMAILMHVPIGLYLWASIARPPIAAIYFVDFADQFGYGFGFAGYMVILMRIAQRGQYATSHMAIGTGLGALLIAIAGATSGVLETNLGYTAFFAVALLAGIPGAISLWFVRRELTPA
jgi:MFS family permease